MAPTSRIYLTRHAQAEHNVDLDYTIFDAPLTPLGKKQASTLSHTLPAPIHNRIDLVVTSPLTRTLQTTLLAYAPTIARLGKENIICLPEAQECNDFACDTGRSRDELEQDPEFAGLDFSRLTDDWNSKEGVWAADARSLAARARAVRQFLRSRPEREIVLVAHGDILRRICASERGPEGYMWKNAEMRVYTFDPRTVEGEECFLRLEEVVEAAGGYGRTSNEMDLVGWNGSLNGSINGSINGKI